MADTRVTGLDIDAILNRATQAAGEFRKLDQEQTNSIVKAAYEAGFNNRVRLAKLACQETKLGIWRDKVIKNVIATRIVYEDIKNLKTVGVISEDEERGIVETRYRRNYSVTQGVHLDAMTEFCALAENG